MEKQDNKKQSNMYLEIKSGEPTKSTGDAKLHSSRVQVERFLTRLINVKLNQQGRKVFLNQVKTQKEVSITEFI